MMRSKRKRCATSEPDEVATLAVKRRAGTTRHVVDNVENNTVYQQKAPPPVPISDSDMLNKGMLYAPAENVWNHQPTKEQLYVAKMKAAGLVHDNNIGTFYNLYFKCQGRTWILQCYEPI